ncbi:MAG: hypothetical protein V7K89_17265 [Nostoc sp.]|uniref:hypothetical protein n=1 Tax=Nostoc sp. TaxID=1180 RepID=UPI002FF6B9D3
MIHFQLFSPDQVRQDLDEIYEDESIGSIWLGLKQSYPRGTEVLVNLELDEKNSGLKMTATLKNAPSQRVSRTFSRGYSDEKIYKELEETIAELNDQNLTPLGVEEALKLALPVVESANKIIDPDTGKERGYLRDDASANLRKFQVSMSKESLKAEYLMNECDHLVKYCGSIIPQPQQERLQRLSQELQDAINTNNLSKIESQSEDARRELDNLPDEVKLIQACFLAIRQACAVAPTEANTMSDKLFRMLGAMESDDGQEANRLWNELQPDIQRWLNEELPSNSIVTGITR